MESRSPRSTLEKTTGGRRWALALLLLALALGAGCSAAKPAESHEEEEALSRTEFTTRIENFFEYEPLVAGKPSQFLIHLTDLSDGTPVEKADVVLTVKSPSGGPVTETKAKVGKVTGIYVAELTIPSAGTHDIEFKVTNPKIDERMPLTGFDVEAAR